MISFAGEFPNIRLYSLVNCVGLSYPTLKDDGILVRDINGNGEIEDGTELFGNNSVLSNGQKAANGFEALKDLDGNHDNIFDQNDTAWNSVKVWKDANQNGFVEDGKISTKFDILIAA